MLQQGRDGECRKEGHRGARPEVRNPQHQGNGGRSSQDDADPAQPARRLAGPRRQPAASRRSRRAAAGPHLRARTRRRLARARAPTPRRPNAAPHGSRAVRRAPHGHRREPPRVPIRPTGTIANRANPPQIASAARRWDSVSARAAAPASGRRCRRKPARFLRSRPRQEQQVPKIHRQGVGRFLYVAPQALVCRRTELDRRLAAHCAPPAGAGVEPIGNTTAQSPVADGRDARDALRRGRRAQPLRSSGHIT